MEEDDLPPGPPRVKPVRAVDPRDEPFVAALALPPLIPPAWRRVGLDELRRAEAERLALFMACRRALCRRTRRCHGRHAECLAENPEIVRPILG